MNNLKRLIPYIKPHRRDILLASVCMILSGLLGGAFLYLMEQVLTPMLDPRLESAERMNRLNMFSLIIFAIALLRLLVDYGQSYLSQRTGQRVLASLRSDLFAHFQSLSVGYFERSRTGDTMSRMTNDLTALQSIMTMAVTTAISSPVEVFISVTYMLTANWKLTLFVLLILPPVALLINRAGHRIRVATTSLQEQLGELVNYLQEKISAIRLIQTFGTRDLEISLFNKVNQTAYSRTMSTVRIQSVLAPVVEFVGMMGVVLSLWFGARDVVNGDMKAAALVTFLFAVHRAAMRAKSLASLNLMFQQGEAAAARIFELMDAHPEVTDAPDAIALEASESSAHLSFEDVRFSYGNGLEVLHGISFEIRPGEVVALAGLSGSGKSTIAALVPRLYDPTHGTVSMDGHDLRRLTLQSLRAQIGAVPQDITLFHGTIRDNIAYGRPDASMGEIEDAARTANAHDFISSQPQGYHTMIGERGGKLSGGQRQRIAIARALLRDPRLLILDEATSSLDAESESLVQDALAKLMHGRTTLVIAHRFSTIFRANRILVLDGGRIAEVGTHEELLAQKGLYHRLYEMQVFSSAADDTQGRAPESLGAKV